MSRLRSSGFLPGSFKAAGLPAEEQQTERPQIKPHRSASPAGETVPLAVAAASSKPKTDQDLAARA